MKYQIEIPRQNVNGGFEMCEPLLPIEELESLKWSVRSLVDLQSRGSCEREICENATRGIVSRIDWVIRQLKASDEGKTNKGV